VDLTMRFLLCIAGLGGLLYGIDTGIIAGALPLLAATAGAAWKLGPRQLGLLVAVLLVDRLGRRFLLLLGSAGISLSLALAGALFRGAGGGLGHGWLVAGCLGGFMASFAVGPGVCAWLALSELMPARIRSNGMGLALLLNQLVGTAIAAAFLPAVAARGYAAPFLAWAGCAAVYFVIVLRFLPETRGRTLEQIEGI
jgi:MFS family permease